MPSEKLSRTPVTKNWFTRLIGSTRIHGLNKSSLSSLCTAIITYVPLCGYLSFDAKNTMPSRTRPQNQILESILEPISNQAEPFIWCLTVLDSLHCPTAQEDLRDPWFTPTTQSYVNLSPILRQNWGPRTTSATFMLLQVARAHKAVVDGPIKIWIYTSSRKRCRKGGWP